MMRLAVAALRRARHVQMRNGSQHIAMADRRPATRRITHCRLLFLLVAASVAGCRAPAPATQAQYERGLIWMFPGVEGGPRSMASAVKGFRDAGVASAIEIHDWERPFGLIRNLTEHERNRRDAQAIASRIDGYVNEYPNNTVDLWGFSGGGGLAIMVAEALADEVRIRNIVLVHPGISPRYDLTRALQHVEGKIVNFHSALDGLVLGLVTTVLGTMDRVHGPSAGWLGFEASAAVPDHRLREKLIQRPWTLDMVPAGHWGGHLSGRCYRWNKTIVAPYLATSNEISSTNGF